MTLFILNWSKRITKSHLKDLHLLVRLMILFNLLLKLTALVHKGPMFPNPQKKTVNLFRVRFLCLHTTVQDTLGFCMSISEFISINLMDYFRTQERVESTTFYDCCRLTNQVRKLVLREPTSTVLSIPSSLQPSTPSSQR